MLLPVLKLAAVVALPTEPLLLKLSSITLIATVCVGVAASTVKAVLALTTRPAVPLVLPVGWIMALRLCAPSAKAMAVLGVKLQAKPLSVATPSLLVVLLKVS